MNGAGGGDGGGGGGGGDGGDDVVLVCGTGTFVFHHRHHRQQNNIAAIRYNDIHNTNLSTKHTIQVKRVLHAQTHMNSLLMAIVFTMLTDMTPTAGQLYGSQIPTMGMNITNIATHLQKPAVNPVFLKRVQLSESSSLIYKRFVVSGLSISER
ncbi:hypothetical protein GQX74_008380 [Glossina fuscipes]|nr:hypothetical protein GQX74_008380 [Glossina fuscipes]